MLLLPLAHATPRPLLRLPTHAFSTLCPSTLLAWVRLGSAWSSLLRKLPTLYLLQRISAIFDLAPRSLCVVATPSAARSHTPARQSGALAQTTVIAAQTNAVMLVSVKPTQLRRAHAMLPKTVHRGSVIKQPIAVSHTQSTWPPISVTRTLTVALALVRMVFVVRIRLLSLETIAVLATVIARLRSVTELIASRMPPASPTTLVRTTLTAPLVYARLRMEFVPPILSIRLTMSVLTIPTALREPALLVRASDTPSISERTAASTHQTADQDYVMHQTLQPCSHASQLVSVAPAIITATVRLNCAIFRLTPAWHTLLGTPRMHADTLMIVFLARVILPTDAASLDLWALNLSLSLIS